MIQDRSTLGRNVLPLERDGLIRIEPSAADARSKGSQNIFRETMSGVTEGRVRKMIQFTRHDQNRT